MQPPTSVGALCKKENDMARTDVRGYEIKIKLPKLPGVGSDGGAIFPAALRRRLLGDETFE